MSFKTFESAVQQVQSRTRGVNLVELRRDFYEGNAGIGRFWVDYTRWGVCQEAKDPFYPIDNLEVSLCDGYLIFEIDEYGASGDADLDLDSGKGWDNDEWECRKIGFRIPRLVSFSRTDWKKGFRYARLLLKGHCIELRDGSFLQGIGPRKRRRT